MKEFLPREYVKTKGIEKKIFAVSHLFVNFVVVDFCECRTYSLFVYTDIRTVTRLKGMVQNQI